MRKNLIIGISLTVFTILGFWYVVFPAYVYNVAPINDEVFLPESESSENKLLEDESVSTGYPTNFDDCEGLGGYTAESPNYISQKGLRCILTISSLEQPEVFNQCKSLGGGITIVEAGYVAEPYSPGYMTCGIYFYESGEKCLDNFCD